MDSEMEQERGSGAPGRARQPSVQPPARDSLSLRLLGEPQLLGGALSLADHLAQKEQALLIYLVCQPDRRFSRDHLATLLWGEATQTQARYNLRRALWNLRRALAQAGLNPEAYLAVEGAWICAPSSAPCSVDVREFEETLQACFQDAQARFSATPDAIRRIRRALDLYRGEFLSGFSPLHAPAFDEWLTVERERLFLLLLRALTGLIQGFIARGEREEAIAACQRLLMLDPLQEDIHRLLMRLYWEAGQRTQAIRQYNTYHELLQRELGIEPLEETQKLYHRIIQQEMPPVAAPSSLALTSRTTPPTPALETLPRPRLFSLLDRGLSLRLTLLSAPPGYGKTTLVSQWLALPTHETILSAWYRVDETDNTPSAFVEGLAASIARARRSESPVPVAPSTHGLPVPPSDPRQAALLLAKAMAAGAPAPFVLVLDDLEYLTGPESRRVLLHLLEHLPPNAHLYLLTRADPPLPLPRLRVRGELLELRAAEIRFTDEEVINFLRRAGRLPLTPDETAELTSRAEGWIAPLWLASHALSRFAAGLDAVWDGVFAYLRDEVLVAQSPETRAFLLRSALLDRLTPSLCAAIGGEWSTGNPAAWLAELEQRNLFLRRIAPREVGEGRSSEPHYAYHPLFLAFLRAELRYHLPAAEIEEVHRRAAWAWEEQGRLEEALSHYQQAGDEAAIAGLLERIAPTYLQEGRLEPLARWLDRLEPVVRDQHPRLTLNAGRLRQAEGRVEEARRLYQRAARSAEAQQDAATQAESLLALAELELLHGHYTAGVALGRQAIACGERTEPHQQVACLCAIAQMEAGQGNLDEAAAALTEARQRLAESRSPLHLFQVTRLQAWLAYLRGDYRRAMGLNSLAEAERAEGPRPSRDFVMTFHNPAPAILCEWGEGELAGELTHLRLAAARRKGDRLALADAHADLGRVQLARGQFTAAEEAFRQVIADAAAAGEEGLRRLCGELYLAYTFWLQGRAAAADPPAIALRRCRSHDASPLELALAQMAVGFSEPAQSLTLWDEARRSFGRMGVRYGVFAAAALLGVAHLAAGGADHLNQARECTVEALAIAAAEGYVQTLLTARRFTLPLLHFAQREGIEPRFTHSLLVLLS